MLNQSPQNEALVMIAVTVISNTVQSEWGLLFPCQNDHLHQVLRKQYPYHHSPHRKKEGEEKEKEI